MDLESAVAVSMLPVSRSRAAAVLKELCLETAGGFGDLDDLLNAVLLGCRIPPAEWRGMTTAARDRTARALRVGAASGMTPLSLLDERYPALLSTIPDPPPVLWIQGASDLLSRPTVAVVGSRGATPYALQVAQRLGDELAGGEGVGRALAAEGREDVEVALPEAVLRVDRDELRRQGVGDPVDPSDDEQGRGVEVGAFAPPLVDDVGDVVGGLGIHGWECIFRGRYYVFRGR